MAVFSALGHSLRVSTSHCTTMGWPEAERSAMTAARRLEPGVGRPFFEELTVDWMVEGAEQAFFDLIEKLGLNHTEYYLSHVRSIGRYGPRC